MVYVPFYPPPCLSLVILSVEVYEYSLFITTMVLDSNHVQLH